MFNQGESTSILSINAGSSSLKLKLFSIVQGDNGLVPKLILESAISGITSMPAKFTFKNIENKEHNIESQDLQDIQSATDAFEFFLEHLKGDDSGFGFERTNHITHICHRLVHGGEIGERGPLVVNDRVVKELEELVTLAPLHNGPASSILKAVSKSLPNAKNVVFFDSSFHSTMPDFVKAYAIDQKVAKERRLRKYGFHGLSYEFIVKSVADYLGKDRRETSIIALHLGSGASMCAIKNGESYDTTLIFHYTSKPADKDKILSSVELSHAENILNSSSGFKALAGTSNFSEILATNPPTPESKLAVNLFLDRILGFFGSYWLKLNGGQGAIDAIVFAGGIGEGSPEFRRMIVEGFSGLSNDFGGLEDDRNKNCGGETEAVYSIGDGNGKVKLLVCKTNEELQMVDQCLSIKALW
ncbi:hypothetical protein TWF281_009117 [Arthrobotrys megalospora]